MVALLRTGTSDSKVHISTTQQRSNTAAQQQHSSNTAARPPHSHPLSCFTPQVHACYSIGNLACNKKGQDEVHKSGGVKALLALLGSGKSMEYAARALGRLAHENLAIQNEVRSKRAKQSRSTARDLLHLPHSPPSSPYQQITRNGGIPALLALLQDINTSVQIQASAALSELCQGANGGKHRKKTQDSIAKAGGIGPLLALVESRYQPVIWTATHTLAMVARTNRANQDTIASMGGIRPLVELLNGSRPDGGHNHIQTQVLQEHMQPSPLTFTSSSYPTPFPFLCSIRRMPRLRSPAYAVITRRIRRL